MERSKAIDILRALAILLVLGRHMPECPETASPFFHAITSVWVRGGWIGVDLFFVLSGFLVSGLLFREQEKYGRISVGRFLLRRGFKIYPAFWVLIAATILAAWFEEHRFEPREILAELFFVQNYFPGLWGHTWSLAVEEHFYLLLVVLLWLLSRRGKTLKAFRHLPMIFLVVAIVCCALRLLLWHVPFDYRTHLFPTHLRIDSLLAGVFISFVYHRHEAAFLSATRRWRWALIAAGLLLLAPAFIFPVETTVFIRTFGLTLFYMGSGCLLMGFMALKLPSWRLITAIAFVGSHSYSVYLWHAWVGETFTRTIFKTDSWFLGAGLYLSCAIFFGIWMALFVEFPVLKLRDRWFPSRGRAL